MYCTCAKSCPSKYKHPPTQISHHSKHSKVLFQYLTPFYEPYNNNNKKEIQLDGLLSPPSSWCGFLRGPDWSILTLHCEFHHLVSVWIFLLRHCWIKTCALRSDVHSDMIWGNSLGICVVNGPRVWSLKKCPTFKLTVIKKNTTEEKRFKLL